MSQDTSLQDLILGYCRQVGGLVEPPAYGVHEVLLPDEVASRWGIEPHQRFAFAETREAGEGEAASGGNAAALLYYGHPLVDQVVDEIRRGVANGLFFVNDVRLEKPGLFALIEKSLSLPNARLFAVPTAVERRRMYHYVRFNFKASLVADEKRELLLPVWMHLQGGYPVQGDELAMVVAWDTESQFKHLEPAEPQWLPDASVKLLSGAVLRPLLERARSAARRALGGTLQTMEKRLQRLLELDRARLQQYYDDLKKDVERRLQKAEAERRQALEAKLAAVEAERQAKLLDVEQKYRLRVDLELVNLAVIAQPKLDLVVEIRKRTATTQRQLAWDPLRHTVEFPTCDVCGLPGDTLYLCENEHLAHAGCMSPQCVECKRSYCRRCFKHVQACVICDRPVCEHSLVQCPVCQRVTCHAHSNLCHAADGEPQRLQATLIAPEPVPEQPSGTSAPRAETTGARTTSRKQQTNKTAKTSPVKKSPTGPVGDYIDVYFGLGKTLVSAYVMAKKREIAVRSWEFEEDGINVHCQCGNWQCRKDGVIYRPAPDTQIEPQIMGFIRELMKEYHVSEKKLHFYQMRGGEAQEVRKLILTGKWKDAAALEAARVRFDRLK